MTETSPVPPAPRPNSLGPVTKVVLTLMATALVFLLGMTAASIGQDDAARTAEACAGIDEELNTALARANSITNEHPEFDTRWRMTGYIMINHPECFSAREVATGQTLLDTLNARN